MKTNLIGIITLITLTVTIFVSCESHEQKADDAFESFKENKMMSADGMTLEKATVEKKSDNTDEWSVFKLETEKKIIVNEKLIKNIRSSSESNAGLLKKATSIEKENNDIRKQMEEYKEEEKLKWENFKSTMNHDVNKINIQLKDLKINIKE